MHKKMHHGSFFKKKSTGESECLCMDGKEVTCASAPPAKFRSAKENDYAVYRKEEKCEIGKVWKEFDGTGFCKKALQYLIFPS